RVAEHRLLLKPVIRRRRPEWHQSASCGPSRVLTAILIEWQVLETPSAASNDNNWGAKLLDGFRLGYDRS
ncbi:hypothetical protein, partial [Sphingomonas sp.]|uniref:hypothetical protein n=1 Tax=Sphingomonas sp. TaxID=28214 RepID=UPI0035A8E709